METIGNSAAVANIYKQLEGASKCKLDNLQIESWPDIKKEHWASLGDYIIENERNLQIIHPAEKWLSIRLDLRGFSRQGKRILPGKGYSPLFAEAMSSPFTR